MASTTPFKPALLVVDMQEDFCPPNGSLAVDGGRDLASSINHLLSLPFALKVATRDWHPASHASFASNHPGPDNEPFKHKTALTNPANPSETKQSILWPAHCVQDSAGAQIIPELHADAFDVVVDKGMHAGVEMYSAFNDIFGNEAGPGCGASVDLTGLLREKGVNCVYVCGLTGDVCVFENAMGARRMGFEVVFLRDLVRSVDEGQEEECVRKMEGVGIVVGSEKGAEVKRVEGMA